MIVRLSKILCVSAVALYCMLAAFGNITDYYSNFSAVEHVLMMRDVFPNSTISYRAINNPILHHVAYITVIISETLTAFLCVLGSLKLFKARTLSAEHFNQAKKWAIGGLTLGFLTWQVLFMSIGGEWFGMWMSPVFKGAMPAAFQIFMTILVVLLYVVTRDE